MTATTGRPATFDEVFAAHHAQLVRLAALLGAHDPEDVAQEAFARLYARPGVLRDPGKVVPYLRSTVCNLARSRLRHLRVVRRTRHEPPLDVVSAEASALLDADRRAVLAAVARIPARQRQALVLRYWLDLSEAEIADAMGISRGAVKSHASRGLAAVEKLLEGTR